MIWLIGNKGMLGTDLGLALDFASLPWIGTDRELDASNLQAVQEFAQKHQPTWIINCAAYTAVDKAEDTDQIDLCARLNIQIPKTIGLVASELGARVIHISTDYVFDGNGLLAKDGMRRPYREDDPVGPTGHYGKTKAEGEAALLAACSASIIIRTAWLYGQHGPNFVFTMLRLMKIKDSLGVVGDQWGSPTWTVDLASAMVHILKHANPTAGIYHFSGEGVTNWHGFAIEIQRLGIANRILEKSIPIQALTSEQYPTKAKRPAWSVLDKSKIKKILGVQTGEWQKSLLAFIEEIKQKGISL